MPVRKKYLHQVRPGTGRRRTRRAAVTLELILTFPIWWILFLAMVEFGQILSNQQQVALASRVGAEEASQTLGLPTSPGPVPATILEAIDQQLASAGMTRCRVTLEHNVVPAPPPPIAVPVTLTSGACPCDPPVTALPGLREYVRVTVCVELTELTPNLLCMFGFDISDKLVQHSTTFRYEMPLP